MNMMGFLRASLLGCALAFAPTGDAAAQSLRVVDGQTSATLSVPLNRAVVVESDMLFAEISVANPAIADIATLSERSIYVLGRAPGRTTMTLLGADGSLIANIEVQVVPDVAELRDRLREILRGEPIEVRTANDGIVLSGTVSSGRIVDRAMELAERYAPGRVSNLLLVGGSQQVMLQVRFAEMSRTVRQELGARVGINGGGGSTTGRCLRRLGRHRRDRASEHRHDDRQRFRVQHPARGPGNRGACEDAGRTQPDGAVGSDRRLPCGR